MNALTTEKSRIGVRGCLAAASVSVVLAVGSISGASAQQAGQATPPAATAPADATAAPAADPDAAAAPAAPVAGMAASPGVAEVENPYGPEHLWEQGDIVSHGTAIVLFIMS